MFNLTLAHQFMFTFDFIIFVCLCFDTSVNGVVGNIVEGS